MMNSAFDDTNSDPDVHNSDLDVQTWEVVLYAIIGSIGLLNNGFTFVVIISSKAMRQKTTNKMIMNQTAIDWIASVLFIANAITVKDCQISKGVYGTLYCRLWLTNYFMWSVLNALSFNLMALTLERYFAVVMPVSYRKFTPGKAKFTMLSVWLAGLLVTTPSIYSAKVVSNGNITDMSNFTNITCMSNFTCVLYPKEPNLFVSINGVFNYIAVFLAPVVLMFFCYSHMILFFCKKKQKSGEETKSHAEKQRSSKMRKLQINIFKTFIIVSVAFIGCWAPSQTLNFLFNIHVGGIDLKTTAYKWTYYLTYANCCMNPFIYTFQYHDFRVALKKLLGIDPGKSGKKPSGPAEQSDSLYFSEYSHTTH